MTTSSGSPNRASSRPLRQVDVGFRRVLAPRGRSWAGASHPNPQVDGLQGASQKFGCRGTSRKAGSGLPPGRVRPSAALTTKATWGRSRPGRRAPE
jgi:hypothetical protein